VYFQPAAGGLEVPVYKRFNLTSFNKNKVDFYVNIERTAQKTPVYFVQLRKVFDGHNSSIVFLQNSGIIGL